MYPTVIIYYVVIPAFSCCLSLPNPTLENWLSLSHHLSYIYIYTQIYTHIHMYVVVSNIRQRCSWMLDIGHSLLHNFACMLDHTFIAQVGRSDYLYWVSESRQRQPIRDRCPRKRINCSQVHRLADSMDMSLSQLWKTEGQGSLVCCSSWGCNKSHMT